MACNLNVEQVSNLYSYLYGELSDRVTGKNKTPFDLKDVMKDLYNFLIDPNGPEFESEEERKEKALYYIQAVPEIVQNILARPNIRNYVLKQNKKLFIDAPTLAEEYSDIENVEKLVKPTIRTKKIITQEVDRDLEQSSTKEVTENPKQNYASRSSKVAYPNSTSGQQAYPIDPKTNKPKDVKDPEKNMFYDVIKDIVYLTKQFDGTNDQVYYGEQDPVALALTLINAENLDKLADPNLLTSVDQKYRNDPTTSSRGVIAIITDTEGNHIYFNEDGTINKDGKGRRVYQYIRKPFVKDNTLFFRDRYGNLTALVSAEELAETWKKNQRANGIRVSDEELAKKTITIRNNQTKLFNDLFRFREVIENSEDASYTIKITGGSYGLSEDINKFYPIAETALNPNDLIFQFLPGGRVSFTLSKSAPAGITVDQMLYLQRPNISNELAGHVADILTTTATLRNKQLTPDQRRIFFEVFFDNKPERGFDTNKNQIIVKTNFDSEGTSILEVSIKGEEPISQEILYTPEGRKLIYDHLIQARTNYNIPGGNIYSAALNYNEDLWDKEYTDYIIDTEKNKLSAEKENYFDFIKEKMLVQYPNEAAGYFSGLNAYLSFEIPQNILPTAAEVFEVGIQKLKEKVEPKKADKQPNAKVQNINDYSLAKEYYNDKKGTWVMRPARGLSPSVPFKEHFGNPWSTKKDSLNKNVKIVKNVSTAVKNYEDWLTGKKHKKVEPERRKFILRAINQGWLDDTTFIYYKPKGSRYKSHADVLVSLINNRNQVSEEADIVIKEDVTTKTRKRKLNKEDNTSIQNTLGNVLGSKKSYLRRSVKLNSFLEGIFTTRKAQQNALDWFNNSFISQVKIDGQAPISLTRLTEIANSDAVATFDKSGITLYKGSSNIDIYHEAWHAFSQLFLTPDEQVDLYDEVRKIPKWKDVDDDLDIEEDIAEDFRYYMKTEKFKESLPNFLRKIFERIGAFLRWAYAGINKTFGKDVTRPRDIPKVRAMFEALRSNNPQKAIEEGLFQSLNASATNITFAKLRRGSRNIIPIKANKGFNEFTETQSTTIVNAMDSLMAIQFQNYNLQWDSTDGYLRVQSSENLEAVYENIKDNFKELEAYYNDQLDDVEEQIEIDKKNGIENIELISKQLKLTNMLNLIGIIIDNYGDINLALQKKQKTGVVAYHIKRSKFNQFKNKYTEVEDTSSIESKDLVKKSKGNVFSSRELATEETKMLLSSIFKIQRDSKGAPMKDETGAYMYEKDFFGLPKLETEKIMFNRLAKVLAGSYDINEIYQRLLDNSENFPEFQQVLELLPQTKNIKIEGGGYNTPTEWKTETNFWQDFKKPRIKYVQLNINKNENGKFDSAVSKASMDVYAVRNEWETNFALANVLVNKYITKEVGTDTNLLNTKKIVEDFGNKKVFTPKESIEFLKALGIELDLSSPAIYNIVYNRKINFSVEFGLLRMLEAIKVVDQSNNESLKYDFAKNPIARLSEGLNVGLRRDKSKSLDVGSRIRILAEIQNEFSDGYSNFSVLNAERNRVWEHFVDNTMTRTLAALNQAEDYIQLIEDPRFKHMRWLAKENNTMVGFSQLMNSLFHMNSKSKYRYKKRKNAELILQNVTGTQLITKGVDETTGNNTASLDAVSKFLQEYHTMLLNGVEEFMRHASKNAAMGLTVSRESEIITYTNKKNKNLYIDIDAFEPGNIGEYEGTEIMIGYLNGESNRIFRFKQNEDKFKEYTGYNRKVKNKLGKSVYAGETFTIFDDILTKETQIDLYEVIQKAVDNEQENFNMQDILEDDLNLRSKVEKDIIRYFNLLTEENLERLDENSYVDTTLLSEYYKKGVVDNLEDLTEMLTKAYTYNSFIHKIETTILSYGDLVQYNHAKEEFHKRNAGSGSGGLGFRTDQLSQKYIDNLNKAYINRLNASRADTNQIKIKKYDGTFNTAIMQELELNSKYYDEYLNELTKAYTERYGDPVKAENIAKKVLKEYKDMKVADGQGYVTFEAYRILKNLENKWSDEQEALYNKVANGENITLEDAIQFFPPYKLQYFGNIESTGLPVTSFHKFSLAPIIPGVAKEGSEMYDLHIKMLEQQTDYVLFQSGSKIAHIGEGDKVFNEDGTFNQDVKFTKNVIYGEYLKNQTEINSSYKNVSIFSTQLRKMILEGLYENGKVKGVGQKEITKKAKEYIRKVEFLTNIHKLELLNEIGYKEENGKFVPSSKASIEKLAEVIRGNLEKEEILSYDLIDFIDVDVKSGNLINDLSLHPDSAKIEKLILSIINKKVIKQKVKGEALVQVSSAFYNNYSSVPANLTVKSKKEQDQIIKKYVGTNFLPTYHKKANGSTAAMKVMIAMQGDYINLFNLEYSDNQTIGVYFDDGTIDMTGSLLRLNEKIKDDAWLDANDGANRKAITLVGVRIPVQGINSMEFMEVYEFLPPQAGNIVIPPAEIVAKSGADYDIDKLTIFMNNLNVEGKVKKAEYNTYKDFKAEYESKKKSGISQGELSMFFKTQMEGVENELINDMKGILELPRNYTSLITPNSNYILEDIAADLSQYVMNYNPYINKMSNESNKTVDDKTTISPTRVLETLYNVYKHEANNVGKKTLGLGAIENTFNVLFNTTGAYMPTEYFHKKEQKKRKTNLWLKHHKLQSNISISHLYDVNNEYKIADIISQMMNGWVDVEKDPWIFFIQGNYETAPILMYLISTGVPIEDAIYFVSNPLTIEYIKEKNLSQSTYAEVLNKKPKYKGITNEETAKRIIYKYFDKNELPGNAKTYDRYLVGENLAKDYLKDRSDKSFNKEEMYDLIVNNKENNGKLTDKEMQLAKTMFLHFLEIEDLVSGLTSLKLSLNPDTSTKATGTEVELNESSIDELQYETKLIPELIDAIKKDSILSSFFNGPLALSIIRPLFKLRYDKHISDYIIENSQQIRRKSNKLLGEGKVDTFITMFKNDIFNMLYQNAVRKYKLTDNYMSYEVKRKIPISLAKDIPSRGAFVKANKDGTKIMYVDEKSLREEFESEAWVLGSEEENSYENRNMYALELPTFMENGAVNFELYLNFVVEREFLRSENPIEDLVNKSWFQEEGLQLLEDNPDVAGTIVAQFVYERYITNKALDNVSNVYHLFMDKNNSLGSRYSKFLVEYKNELLDDYQILNVLKTDSTKNKSMFNLYIADKDIDTNMANTYTKNLKDLSDRSVLKIADKDKNDLISDMFALMSNFAFIQSGINKTKYNFTNVVSFTNYLEIMKEEGEIFQKALETNSEDILDYLFKQFSYVNSRRNINRNRFKDYLNNLDLKNPEKTKTSQPQDDVKYNYNPSNVSEEVRNNNKQYVLDKLGKPVSITFETSGNDSFYRFTFSDGLIIETPAKGRMLSFPKMSEKVAKLSREDLGYDIKFLIGLNKLAEETTTQPQGDVFEESIYELEETDRANIFKYNDQGATKSFYDELAKNNEDVVFITNNVNETYNNPKRNFGGQQELGKSGMIMPITTSLSKLNDNFENLPKEAYNDVLRLWEEEISHIKSVNNGTSKLTKIAFPTTGFADVNVMPQELFVYLSKRLFDEFGYVNPGSTMDVQMVKNNIIAEGITDEEILVSLELEEDPFKCK